jgi:hypothetical protein
MGDLREWRSWQTGRKGGRPWRRAMFRTGPGRPGQLHPRPQPRTVGLDDELHPAKAGAAAAECAQSAGRAFKLRRGRRPTPHGPAGQAGARSPTAGGREAERHEARCAPRRPAAQCVRNWQSARSEAPAFGSSLAECARTDLEASSLLFVYSHLSS